MSKTYEIVSLVKDRSLREVLKKAVSDDGKISRREVLLIIKSTLDGDGVTHQEFNDLQTILKTAKTLDDKSKLMLRQFLGAFKYYHHYLQHQSKKKIHTVAYTSDHIPLNTNAPKSRRPAYSMIPEYLTIHSTANPKSTAKNERGWLTRLSNTGEASYHLVVDEIEAIECIPLNEVAWHAGDGSKGAGNRKSIGLEICESGDRTKTLKNAISLASKILKEKGWKTTQLKRHKDWSGKNCPRILIDSNSRKLEHQTWEWFKKEVQKNL